MPCDLRQICQEQPCQFCRAIAIADILYLPPCIYEIYAVDMCMILSLGKSKNVNIPIAIAHHTSNLMAKSIVCPSVTADKIFANQTKCQKFDFENEG